MPASIDCCPRIIFLDLDGTIWSSRDISSSSTPFVVKNDYLIDNKGAVIRLYDGVKRFLQIMSMEGIPVYSLSWNYREKAVMALKLLGIYDLFAGHYIEPHPRKGLVMKKALRERGLLGLKPCEIVYVDDRDIHLEDVWSLVGKVSFIHLWKDVKSYDDLIKIILCARNKLCK